MLATSVSHLNLVWRHDLSPQAVLFSFLPFDMLCNILLKARHVVSGNKSCDIFAFSVSVYVSLTRRLLGFGVCCSRRYRKLSILLVSLSLSLVLTWSSLSIPLQSVSCSSFSHGELLFWSHWWCGKVLGRRECVRATVW